jgi:hypothetical protein
MTDTASFLVIASTGTLGLAAAVAVCLRGWRDWLEVKRIEIERRRPGALSADLAGLRERVRRLETIASGGES